MDHNKPKISQPGGAFPMPAEFKVFTECLQTFAHLHVFRVTLECDGVQKEIESKAFDPRDPQQAAMAWLEFMSLTGNVIITSVMPPDMLSRFIPTQGGGMRIISPEEGN